MRDEFQIQVESCDVGFPVASVIPGVDYVTSETIIGDSRNGF